MRKRFAHGRQNHRLRSAKRKIVLSQHLLAACVSHCYDSLKRSSGEWMEACTFPSGVWSGAPALHLRAQCTYQEKLEHEHRRTRHKRRALSTGQRTETRTTARPTNKQHTNDWSSAFFRQFRRFAPILEPSLHGARGLTSFIHHTSDALRTLCSQMGTTPGASSGSGPQPRPYLSSICFSYRSKSLTPSKLPFRNLQAI